VAEFPYITNPARVKAFFQHIEKAGVPEKVTYRYLESSGFKSKNDRRLIPILKFIGFLDSSGVPTEDWRAYREKERARRVVATAIRRSYRDLFHTYPDGHRQDDEALHNFFAAHTTVAESTRKFMVGTFKALCELADFEAAPAEVTVVEPTAPAVPSALVPSAGIKAVNINIQLTLPATDDPAVYDNLFAALKKHLLS